MTGTAGTHEAEVLCPFCGEPFTIVVDTSVDEQTYIEDCYVCCRPIQFTIICEEDELISIDTGRG
ncbi:MAG: CPXCG motif-containing cysteine-rich protein [Deltaproteobacteria bacterium]|nr:CPXCG motif-containing cysteine-rich protein [Deltaproteobacteria bacterium]